MKSASNVKKCIPNIIVLNHNVIWYGKIKLDKLNLETVCVNKRNRHIRHRNICSNVVTSIANLKGYDQEEDKKLFMKISLDRNRELIISSGIDI